MKPANDRYSSPTRNADGSSRWAGCDARRTLAGWVVAPWSCIQGQQTGGEYLFPARIAASAEEAAGKYLDGLLDVSRAKCLRKPYEVR